MQLMQNNDRRRLDVSEGAAGRTLARGALVVLTLFALAVFAVGCGESAQRSVGSTPEPEEGAASASSTQQGAVQGTTSRSSGGGAESTVGTIDEPETSAQTTEQESSEISAEASEPETAENTTPHTEESGGASAASAGQNAGRRASGARGAVEADFVADPEDSGGSGYGADSILGVRFGDHDGYERVVVDLGSGEEPAAEIPKWTLSSPTGDGRLKLNLPSARSTEVSDGSLEGAGAELLNSFYVVRAPDGGMFVDFFAERSFYYRVIELSGPSRIAIDFKPAGSELDIPLPTRDSNTVVTEPRKGDSIGAPLTVSGYSRNPEASNNIMLQGPEGETLARETVLSNDWTETWGYFETTLEAPTFTGEATLKVGTQSARDGSFEGVELPVQR